MVEFGRSWGNSIEFEISLQFSDEKWNLKGINLMKFNEINKIDDSMEFCKILYINLYFFFYLFDYSNFNNWVLLLKNILTGFNIRFFDFTGFSKNEKKDFLIPDSRINCFLIRYIYIYIKRCRNLFGWSSFRKWWGWFCICYLLIYIARHYSIYIIFIFVSY